MKTSFPTLLAVLLAGLLPLAGRAQVASGSNGSDGAFNPTASVVIDMADHPDGIYQYTSVNIPAGVTVSFLPNANNKPVVWLVQGSCTIGNGGYVHVNGVGNNGGPGGFRGGLGGGYPGADGQGPGAGKGASSTELAGGNASFGTVGQKSISQVIAGALYGNAFLIPLIGGSGGGGGGTSVGGGGGGAILIAAYNEIIVNGSLTAYGADSSNNAGGPGAGSGGAIRLMATTIRGSGEIYVTGGFDHYFACNNRAGEGRLRFDMYNNSFNGNLSNAVFTQGFQPIIIPAAGQGIQLSIASVGGVAAPVSPSGVLANPDVIVSAQQVNPIPVVVNCTNLPLNSEITVKVQPANGAAVTAVGLNNAGTLAASTATVAVNMPRGGGIIYATAVTGLAGGGASIGHPADAKTRTLAETGWTADGESFTALEITATLGGKQTIAYLTKSGKRYPAN